MWAWPPLQLSLMTYPAKMDSVLRFSVALLGWGGLGAEQPWSGSCERWAHWPQTLTFVCVVI